MVGTTKWRDRAEFEGPSRLFLGLENGHPLRLLADYATAGDALRACDCDLDSCTGEGLGTCMVTWHLRELQRKTSPHSPWL